MVLGLFNFKYCFSSLNFGEIIVHYCANNRKNNQRLAMKKSIIFILAFAMFNLVASAQEEASLVKKINDLTYDWDLMSTTLNNYEGLGKFCSEASYRNEFVVLLQGIHHFDSVLYDKLTKAARMSAHNHDIKKAIEEIHAFEKEYDTHSFIRFLHDECVARQDIEKNAEALKGDVGSDSYGGQIYILESELNKYIKHITKRVDHIRKHVHHLHIQ